MNEPTNVKWGATSYPQTDGQQYWVQAEFPVGNVWQGELTYMSREIFEDWRITAGSEHELIESPHISYTDGVTAVTLYFKGGRRGRYSSAGEHVSINIDGSESMEVRNFTWALEMAINWFAANGITELMFDETKEGTILDADDVRRGIVSQTQIWKFGANIYGIKIGRYNPVFFASYADALEYMWLNDESYTAAEKYRKANSIGGG